MVGSTDETGELGGVAETLLVPLWFRAQEARRPDAILVDERAVALVEQLGADSFSKVRRIHPSEGNEVARFLLTRQLDRTVTTFLLAHPDAVVVHVGCGLDSRFERVDDGRVEWFDLDLPEVIALRRRLLGDEGPRYHLLSGSVSDPGWRARVTALGPRPVLFVAEAVLVWFEEARVRELLVGLARDFPGSELVFDAWSPAFVWWGNRQLAPAGLDRMRWGLRRARSLEGWADGLRVIGQWGFFDEPEPRMAPYRWVAPAFRLFAPIRVLRVRLGPAADTPPERASARAWLAVVFAYAVVPALLVGVGRDPGWWQAWAFSAVVSAAGIGGRGWADRVHPGLQADRARFGQGEPGIGRDRVLSSLMGLSVLYLPALIAALDHAGGWSAAVPAGADVAGLLICAASYTFTVWALVENRFFSSVVRIQPERGHVVCDTGPYALVRHPAYAGNLFALVGLPLALGSWWAFVGSAVGLLITVVRTVLEERVLTAALPGYAAYTRRVRSRLVPGIW